MDSILIGERSSVFFFFLIQKYSTFIIILFDFQMKIIQNDTGIKVTML